MKRLNQSGSHLLAALVFVLVVGVIGLAGYKVWQNNQTTDTGNTPTKTAATVPTTIKNSADLTSVSKVLDSSATQIDGSLNDTTLNTDLNDLL
jgi:predicted negative regulator of RcsB-dependent stress response